MEDVGPGHRERRSSTSLLTRLFPVMTSLQSLPEYATSTSTPCNHQADPCYPPGQGRQVGRPRLARTYRGSSYRRSEHHTNHTAIAQFSFAAGLRLHQCTFSEDLHLSHTRHFGRNIKVSRSIKQKTGVYHSTRQISSRIQVFRSLWRDTEGTRAIPAYIIVILLSALSHESNLIGGPLSRLCSRRPAIRTTPNGIQIGVRRPTPRAGPPRGSTTVIRRQTRRASGGKNSRVGSYYLRFPFR